MLTALGLGTRPLKYREGESGRVREVEGSVHCRMLRVLLIARPSVASRAFWCLDTLHKHSNLGVYSFQNEAKRKTPLFWAFPINTFQNANQKPIRSVLAYQLQCTFPPQPDPPFNFQGSGSETIIQYSHSCSIPSLLSSCLLPFLSFFLLSFLPCCSPVVVVEVGEEPS